MCVLVHKETYTLGMLIRSEFMYSFEHLEINKYIHVCAGEYKSILMVKWYLNNIE